MTSSLSIITICQDEQDIIGWMLDCCVHDFQVLGKQLHEVVVVDGGSKDGTVEIVKSYSDKLPLVLLEYPFDTFGDQKNRALERCTGDFIFAPDSDMTWTTNFAQMFLDGIYEEHPFWDFRLFFTVDDGLHYFWSWGSSIDDSMWDSLRAGLPLGELPILDDNSERRANPNFLSQRMMITLAEARHVLQGPNMRLWRRGPYYIRKFHETLEGQNPGLPICPHVIIFENSIRASDEALRNRGRRYQRFIAEMTAAGQGPGREDRYITAKYAEASDKMEFPKWLHPFILASTL